jgi:hypothetical protein
VSPSQPSAPRPERRAADRRAGADRRGTQRRVVVDRRYASDRRSQLGPHGFETPLEHIRNAMQVLIGAVESETPLTSDDFARRAEAALERLTRALSSLEVERRR